MINAWDKIFREQGKVFTKPHADMPMLLELFRRENITKILDLGCGTGRHTVYFAEKGFSVWGLDSSPKALAITDQWLKEEGLSVSLKQHEMVNPFPYPDGYFDAIISIQVIHHADLESIKKTIAEIKRLLKVSGLAFVTVPKFKNQAGKFNEIEPNTFIPLDGQEAGLPHHYFTPEELKSLFQEFQIIDFHLDQVNHYCLLVKKV